MTFAATLIILGRVILGLFFLIAGARNFMGFQERVGALTNYGWPLPTWLIALGFAAQIAGGLSLIFGIMTVWGAVVLILFLIGATALFHNFTLFKGEERKPHLYLTLVNCTLVGHCLMVIGTAL